VGQFWQARVPEWRVGGRAEPEATVGAACPSNVKLLPHRELEQGLARQTAKKLTEHAYVTEERLAARLAAAANPNADGGEVSLGAAWLSQWRRRPNVGSAPRRSAGGREHGDEGSDSVAG